jgi:hypothetical protein
MSRNWSSLAIVTPLNSNRHDLARLVEWQWSQEKTIDQVESSGIRPRPDRQAEKCGHRPGWLPPKHPAALADFSQQRVHITNDGKEVGFLKRFREIFAEPGPFSELYFAEENAEEIA